MFSRRLALAACALSLVASAAHAIDDATRQRGRDVAAKAIEFLRSEQDAATGAWAYNPEGPNLPAITGLVINGMLKDPRIDARDEVVAQGLAYILSMQQPDGGIYDTILPNYNTSICLSALAAAQTPEATAAMSRGRSFLLGLQYHEGGEWDAEAPDFNEPVSEDHPYYGGVGYGRHGRPDLSNLSFFLQAMHDTGVSAQDPAIQRALVFLSRTQMLDETNDMPYADGSSQGGFIYATVPNRESIDGRVGQSQAGEFEETMDDGTRVSRLRAYGSMTYAGFKSLIYADLERDDPRVVAAERWIREHYTLDENPGLGDDGLYYYYLTMARALDAWGKDELSPVSEAEPIDWRTDLITTLASLQNEDGSFTIRSSRWMEDNEVLVTAYALLAVQEALGR
jgi:squalene-hopene/tetraprenyl-beta-curcumene cyclase